MRIFKTRWFARFSGREGLPDDVLIEAIARAERGLVDADLGNGLIKQRVARSGKGRSGGYRMLIAYQRGKSAYFVYGFAKSRMENIPAGELLSARTFVSVLAKATTVWMANALADGSIEEI